MIFQRVLQISMASVVAIATGVSLITAGCASVDRGRGPYGYAEPAAPEFPSRTAEAMPRPVVFKNLLFGNNASTLNADARAVLDDAAAMLRANPNDSLVITGYASDPGSSSYNMVLGARRAEAAKAYLVSKGIAPDRLKIQSAGEEEPAVPNTSSDLRALNRRVVLTYTRGW